MELNKIYAYKHNGKLHRIWNDLTLLEETDEYYILESKKGISVTESEKKNWYTREKAIIYFSKKYWFNIVVMYKKNRVSYYCNLASLPIVELNSIKYIDYDLDVKYFSDTKDIILLDEKEFNQNIKKYDYPEWVIEKVEKTMNVLYEWIKEEKEPFNKEFRDKWR